MAWEKVIVRLECGCAGTGTFDEALPGDVQRCKSHRRDVPVVRVSRIRESVPSKNYSLGIEQEHDDGR